MTEIARGAWVGGGYAAVLRGSSGDDLASGSDNLGWACFAWKYALAKNGHRGAMVLDTPVLGDAARTQVKAFQAARGIGSDGVIGPRTGELLLRAYFMEAELNAGLPLGTVWQIGALESNFDVGAVGFVDANDRGPVQTHIYESPRTLTLGQAIRPAWSIPRAASRVARVAKATDLDTGVASWNVGEGGAEWVFDHGKPASGSPDWWHGAEDLSERYWRYLELVRGRACPYA